MESSDNRPQPATLSERGGVGDTTFARESKDHIIFDTDRFKQNFREKCKV